MLQGEEVLKRNRFYFACWYWYIWECSWMVSSEINSNYWCFLQVFIMLKSEYAKPVALSNKSYNYIETVWWRATRTKTIQERSPPFKDVSVYIDAIESEPSFSVDWKAILTIAGAMVLPKISINSGNVPCIVSNDKSDNFITYPRALDIYTGISIFTLKFSSIYWLL